MNRKKRTPKWKQRLQLKLTLPKDDRREPKKKKIQNRIRRISEEFHEYQYSEIEFGSSNTWLSDSITNRVQKVKIKGKFFALKIFKLLEAKYSSTRYQSILREIRALHAYTNENRESKRNERCNNSKNNGDVSGQLDPTKFHNYIIRLFDVYRKNGTMQLLLEFMDKGSLRSVMDRKIPTSEEVVSVLSYNILKALSYLKRQNIIHRDIKPENILISSRGFVKLGDFDLCKRQRQLECVDGEITSSPLSEDRVAYSATKGTFLFMSPQQIMGERIDEKTDVYSLGISMLECILGKFPYDLDNNSQSFDPWTYLDYLSNELPKLEFFKDEEKERVHLSEEFKEFCRSCTYYDQSRRPSANELLQLEFIKKYNYRDGFGEEERRKIIRDWIQN